MVLSPKDLQTAEQLRRDLNPSQLAWLSGYFAGAANGGFKVNGALAAVAAENADAIESENSATVLYGSQSGNGKKVAEALAAALNEKGARANAVSMENYKTSRLKREKQLFAVVSTHGEGDPPDAALGFLQFLQSKRAPKLPQLKYAVLALGDSSYEHFCKTGRDLHNLLAGLGARAIKEVAECDADYETDARAWRESIAAECERISAQDSSSVITVPASLAAKTETENSGAFDAEVLANIKLSGEGRDVRHLELSLQGAGLMPQPGDSIGVLPQNNKRLAQLSMELLRLRPDDNAEINGESANVEEWLRAKLDIARLTPPVLQKYAALADNKQLNEICAERKQMMQYAAGRDLPQLLTDFPFPKNASGTNALKCLRRLAPRLYSLASAREDEAHLLIADSAYYDANGKLRRGVCGEYLSSLAAGDEIKVFVQENEEFRPPQDSNAPIVMIGAGAGVAPFRAFMEQRDENGGGEAWLFFGERRRRDDFYYQREWLARLQNKNGGGGLSKLSAAFSRDGANKIYVQHKLRDNAAELLRWLENGASVYVCGDEKRMARGVHSALAELAGEETLAAMQRDKRYRRDVY